MLADGAVVGRILKVHAAPVGSPWMWTLAFGQHEDRTPTHGYAASAKKNKASATAELIVIITTSSLSRTRVMTAASHPFVQSRCSIARGGGDCRTCS